MVFNLPKNVKSMNDILMISEVYFNYLRGCKVKFDDNNMPVFKTNWFLEQLPNNVMPFSHRKMIEDTKKCETVLCFFSPDKLLYPRLVKVFNELEEYKKYAGVIGMDLSMTPDMDDDFAVLYLQLNLMFLAILGVNGIKIVMNSRIPNIKFVNYFSCIPRKIMYATSTLGSTKTTNYDYNLKLLVFEPNKIIIYGKENPELFNLLDSHGVYWKHYLDIHNSSKGQRNE